MATKWQETAIEIAARRFPTMGSKDDRDIWISMRGEAVARLPTGETATEGWIKINILGKLQIERQPLMEAVMAMDDENFKYNMNGRYVIHLPYSDFKKARIVEGGTPDFVQEGNHFSPDIEHLMLSIDCAAFVDDDELNEMGGGVPASSEFADARKDAEDCDEDPDEWVLEIMKVAESNIRASLRSIILFDEDIQGDSIDVLLIDYKPVSHRTQRSHEAKNL